MSEERPGLFVGRRREMAALEEAVANAASGLGGLVVVSGEAGAGKSRLLTALAERATSSGARVLWGRCWEQAGAPLYWPWVQVLRTGTRGLDASIGERLGPGASRLTAIAPEIGRTLGIAEAPADPQAPAESERFRLHDTITILLHAIAEERPLVLLFDDVHFSDRPSLMLMQHLAREAVAMPLLIVAAYRPEDARVDDRRRESIAALARAGRHIVLGGLSDEEVRRLAGGLGLQLDEAKAARLREVTAGNPFFVTEVAHGAIATPSSGDEFHIPETVRDAVRARLHRLTPEAIDILRGAAAIGRTFQLGELAPVTGMDGSVLAGVLDLAAQTGVLVGTGASFGSYSFVHAIMQESLYADIPIAERPALHLKIARALESFYGDAIERHLAEIAHHLFASGDEGALDALSYASRAGKQAAERLEWEAAVENYERAFALLERLRADRAARCAFLLEYSEALGHAGERDRACTRIREAVRLAHEVGDWDALLRASFALVNWRTAPAKRPRRSGDEAEARARDLRRALEALPDPESLTQRLDLSHQMAEAAAEARRSDLLLHARKWQLLSMLEAVDGPGFRTMLQDTIDEARRGLLPSGSLPMLRSFQALFGGSLDVAERMVVDALAGGEDYATAADEMLIGQILALADRRARFKELTMLWQSMANLDPLQPGWSPYIARLQAKSGAVEQARVLFERYASRGFDSLQRDWSWLPNVLLLAETCFLTGGSRDPAERLREMILPYAERFATFPLSFAPIEPVSRGLALLSALLGERDEALRHLDDAIAVADTMGFRYSVLGLTVERAMIDGRADSLGAARTAGAEAASLGYTTVANAAARLAEHAAGPAAASPPARSTAGASPRKDGGRATFRREGAMWTIAIGGGSPVRLPDSKGLSHIHLLLSNPGREFHVLDLMGPAERPARAAGRDDGLAVADGEGIPMLDEEAKSAFKARLEQLREEQEEAESWGDAERASRARQEIEAITQELARSIGLGGRDRTTGGAAERARVNVTRVIKRAIDAIGEHDAVAARYLSDTIRRGAFCSYDPDPTRPLTWNLS